MYKCQFCEKDLAETDKQTRRGKKHFHLKCFRKIRKLAKKHQGGNIDNTLKGY